jgi:tetraacyldisaccharide 4'-kinase
MREPAFWRSRGLLPTLLAPSAALYGAVAGWRMSRQGERAAVPVICVGNFTVGGAGKTPAALAVAALLAAAGERPAFLTRGYGGSLPGPLRVDPERHGAAEVGDEPLLLARAAPTIMSRDRPAGARLAVEIGAGVVVMDDGLQNPSLLKDLSFAVVDAATGIGNGLPLPAGPLRAPLNAQWPRVDAVILVGDGEAGDALAREAERRGRPVLRARIAPDPAAVAGLGGRRVLAFAGIGRPPKFFETLEACGATVERRHAFPDHHPYTAAEVNGLVAEAAAEGLTPVTTEKDRVRVERLDGAQAAAIVALPVRLVFRDEAAARTLLRAALERRA